MTDTELLNLWRERMVALNRTISYTCRLSEMDPETRRQVDRDSSRFRDADAAITAELRRRPGPAELDGVTLWATQDRLHFVALQPGTRRLVGCGMSGRAGLVEQGMLYRYGNASGNGNRRREEDD